MCRAMRSPQAARLGSSAGVGATCTMHLPSHTGPPNCQASLCTVSEGYTSDVLTHDIMRFRALLQMPWQVCAMHQNQQHLNMH